jgi:hypothetical protein
LEQNEKIEREKKKKKTLDQTFHDTKRNKTRVSKPKKNEHEGKINGYPTTTFKSIKNQHP